MDSSDGAKDRATGPERWPSRFDIPIGLFTSTDARALRDADLGAFLKICLYVWQESADHCTFRRSELVKILPGSRRQRADMLLTSLTGCNFRGRRLIEPNTDAENAAETFVIPFLEEQAENIVTTSKIASKAAQERWKKARADAMRPHSDRIAGAPRSDSALALSLPCSVSKTSLSLPVPELEGEQDVFKIEEGEKGNSGPGEPDVRKAAPAASTAGEAHKPDSAFVASCEARRKARLAREARERKEREELLQTAAAMPGKAEAS